jgi:hypothetical protein
MRLYEENELDKHLDELEKLEETDDHTGLTNNEKVLMKILKEIS